MFGHHHHRGMRHPWAPHHGMGARGFGGRGFGGDRERGRGGRPFEQGDLKWVLLALVNEAPRHGYELMKAIEERLGGGYSPSPGVVYPTLTLLEEMGYATVTEEGGRKRYAATDEGRAALDENRPAVDALFARMDEVKSRSVGAAPQVARAMENLRTALRMKLQAGALDAATEKAVADALDQAASKIADAGR